jgi:hypothetical protein
MSGSRQDWLDESTTERLLRGERVASSRADASEPLAALLAAAAAGGRPDPAGEEAALAAYRAARSDTAVPVADAAALSGPPGTSEVSGAPELSFGSGGRHRARMDRLRDLPGSAKVAVAAAFATTALVGGVAAAAGTGVIPYPFMTTSSDSGPTPQRGKPTPSTDGSAAPGNLQVTGSPSHHPSPSYPPPPSVSPGALDSPGSSGLSAGTGAGIPAPTAYPRPQWPECRQSPRPDHGEGAPTTHVPYPDAPWAPAKHPHVAQPGMSDQLTYFAPDSFSDAGEPTAKTAGMPTQPQQPQQPQSPSQPQQPQPSPQPPQPPSSSQSPQQSQASSRSPQQSTAWPPFPSHAQDARYAPLQRGGQARHAKRPKHAKPSAWRTPCRLRAGSEPGR